MMIRILTLRGFDMTRKEYLIGLSEEYGVSRSDVFTIASLLGEDEDYDGLISMLQDHADGLGDWEQE
jgi:hypothetical protein